MDDDDAYLWGMTVAAVVGLAIVGIALLIIDLSR
jgi:hypothetical protein